MGEASNVSEHLLRAGTVQSQTGPPFVSRLVPTFREAAPAPRPPPRDHAQGSSVASRPSGEPRPVSLGEPTTGIGGGGGGEGDCTGQDSNLATWDCSAVCDNYSVVRSSA